MATAHVRWLIALVEQYGPGQVGRMEQRPPAGWSFEEWRARDAELRTPLSQLA